MYNTQPNCYLCTSSPPGNNGVGQIFNRHLIKALGIDNTFVVDVNNHAIVVEDANQYINQTNYVNIAVKGNHSYSQLPCPLKQLGAISALYFNTLQFANKLYKYLQSRIISISQKFIFVMENPVLMLAAGIFASKHPGNTVLLFWDHPEHVLAGFGHKDLSLSYQLRMIQTAIKHAASILCVSDQLKEYCLCFRDIRHPEDIKTLRSPIMTTRPNASNNILSNTQNDQSIAIGFAGSVTSPREFESLQSALDMVNWSFKDKKIILRLYGSFYRLNAKCERRIEYRGYLNSPEDTRRELCECHLLYLPQPFNSTQELVSRYSFPNKLSVYLEANVPILLHAPIYGSIPTWITKIGNDEQELHSNTINQIGYWSNNQELNDLPIAIDQILTNTENIKRTMNMLSEEHFSQQSFRLAIEQIVSR